MSETKHTNNKDNKKKFKNVSKKNINPKKAKAKKILKIALIVFVVLVIVGAGVFAGVFFSDKWGITKDTLTLSKINTTVYDKDGNEIATVAGDEKRKIVALNDIPQNLRDAFVSIEDERFYQHHGVDIKRTIGATLSYIIHRGNSSYGGSTITQQLVKNLMNDKDDSGAAGMQRKIREMSRAYQVEKLLSKDQILELYLNVIFMGGNVYGVELASEYYFNKPVNELDLAQCAFIAGINHSPNSYNPFGENDNSGIIKKRSKTVLGKMKQLGKINEEDYNSAVSEIDNGLAFEQGKITTDNTMSYLAREAIKQVSKQYAEENSLDQSFAQTKIESGGFKIYTTQDSNIQSNMESIYHNDKYILSGKKAHAQSAMVIMDHKTGSVVGLMGGLGDDVNSNGLNRATQSTRQPGSSMKPIASIAPSLESGIITAATVYDDSPTDFGNYSPKDSGNNYQGLSTVRKAIEVSANVPEVKIMSELGPSNSIEFLRKLGITSLVTSKENKSHNDENLSMVLGGLTNGICPLEMAGAYSAIANDGVYITPTFYSKVEDATGNIVLEPNQQQTRVMSKQNAYIEKSILTGPVVGSHGTATGCKISGMDVGAKTGTTDDNKDRWLCGFTSYYTAATWYGYDDNQVIRSSYNPAARIWAAVMDKVHNKLEGKKFEEPDRIVKAKICLDSGKVATSSCARTYEEIFVEGTVPDECSGHKTLTICNETGKIANEFCTDTTRKTFLVKPDKENTTAWKTKDADKYFVPTEICSIHTKAEKKMPNVEGLSKENATAKLKELGLTVDYTTSEGDSDNVVLKQSKSEGSVITDGESVTLTISKKTTKTPTNTTSPSTDNEKANTTDSKTKNQ